MSGSQLWTDSCGGEISFWRCSRNGVYRGNESGRDDRQPQKGELIHTCKMNGRREKKWTVQVTEQTKVRLQLDFTLCIFSSPEEFRHQLGLFFGRHNLLKFWLQLYHVSISDVFWADNMVSSYWGWCISSIPAGMLLVESLIHFSDFLT